MFRDLHGGTQHVTSGPGVLHGCGRQLAGLAPATVSFAGLVQGFLGLYQFNVVIPKVNAGDAVPFTFSLNGAAGKQTLLVPIGN